MANQKATGSPVKVLCLAPKGAPKKIGAVQPGIVITAVPKSITLQAIDANGNAVPIAPTDSVTGTLASDSTNFVIGAGTDTTNYVATIPANTPFGTIANLAATEQGTIQGAAANLTASVEVTLNIPPAPVAVDLQIIFG